MRFFNNSSWPGIARSIATGLVDIVFPPLCLVCETRLDTHEKAVCTVCWSSLQPTDLGNWRDRVTHSEHLDHVLTGWFLDSSLHTVVHELKYNEKRVLAHELGWRMARLLGPDVGQLALDVVVPVPLHSSRSRERGYNQSELLARSFAASLGLSIETKLLLRKGNTPSQTKLTPVERLENVRGAFVSRDFSEHNRFLIVDDVLTTGATLSACAEALRKAGAKFVAAATAGTPRVWGVDVGQKKERTIHEVG